MEHYKTKSRKDLEKLYITIKKHLEWQAKEAYYSPVGYNTKIYDNCFYGSKIFDAIKVGQYTSLRKIKNLDTNEKI